MSDFENRYGNTVESGATDRKLEEVSVREIAPQRKHFYQLDSLRGIAAIAVAIHHWHIFWKLCPHSKYLAAAIQILPFRFLVAGHSSVMMFFVLSGFVLALPQLSDKAVIYPAYAVKRICRIYIPYLVALGVALLGCWIWHGQKTYGPWVDEAWRKPPEWGLAFQHIMFLGVYDVGQYNVSFWTLVHEMRISLVFPVLCALVLMCRARGGLLIATACFALCICFEKLDLMPYSYSETVGYSGMFVLGILLAKYKSGLHLWLRTLRPVVYWGVFLACVSLYAYFPSWLNHLNINSAACDSVTAIGAAGIILYSLTNIRIEELLLRRPIIFLGRISYSLYLLHMPILFAFGHVFYGKVTPIVWLAPYLVSTIGLAALMYRVVELPSIHLGRILANGFGRSHWHSRGQSAPAIRGILNDSED